MKLVYILLINLLLSLSSLGQNEPMTMKGQDTTKIDGFTPEQRFFLSLGQITREKYQDKFALYLINVDPHSPNMYRVNGPVMNCDAFYKAFAIQPGDKMYVADSARIKIW